jgi:cyclopropane-fatty-acyl-phospholipid synthase
MPVAEVLVRLLGTDRLPFRLEAYDGSFAGPADAELTVTIVRREALSRILTRPGELGLGRAYVAGDIELDGPIYPLFQLEIPPAWQMVKPGAIADLLGAEGMNLLRPLSPPESEARQHGLIHSRSRDAAAISHHYDVSNEFYELFLGPSMTYSCAVFDSPDSPLDQAQVRKVDLIARKLELRPGMRLLDVGCGWGTMVIHAAKHYGVHAVGITLSQPQADYARERARAAGVADLVEFRVQDYRDVDDPPFDAISSIGMFEHVGRRSMELYVNTLWRRLRPGGRFLNHAIGRPVGDDSDQAPSRLGTALRSVAFHTGMRLPSRTRSAFVEHYVFPDGELHEVGSLITMFQQQGFEVRHLESLREHYALTLRHWVANLDANAERAREFVGDERLRVWRMYMAGSAVNFERHRLEIHQVLCVRPDVGRSGMPLRPMFEPVEDERWVDTLACSEAR